MAAIALRKLARAGRNFELTWRYCFNLAPTLSYRFSSRHLSPEAARVVGALKSDGIAVSSIERLLADPTTFHELREAVAGLGNEEAHALAEKRSAASDAPAIGRKSFNVELLGSRPVFDPQSIYARFALQPLVLKVANAYFGMYTRLRYYNVWHTFATRGRARESQLWHRDREDHLILKMFVYLSDVDEGAGPFSYAAGSHRNRGAAGEPAYILEGGVKRSNDLQMAAVVPPERWVKAVGQQGTIVFADTHGYHKGGLARERDRLMYLCMFTSQASQSKEHFLWPERFERPRDKANSFALSGAFVTRA